MAKSMIHPVWIKKGAVSPRNQKNKLTGQDIKSFYLAKDDKQGKTLIDIKNECKLWQLRNEICGPKVRE